MEEIIKIENLTKTYEIKKIEKITDYFKFRKKQITALKDINISVNKNEFLGLLGENGSGKSTLIKCITGLIYPTQGSVRVFGINPIKNRAAFNKKISVVFGQRSQLRWDLSVKESYFLIKEMYDVSNDEYNEKMKLFEKYLKISEIINQPVRTLSLGQKMRAELGAALIYNPELIILDEPTIGLDVLNKELIINFLLKIKEEKKLTLILTTHDVNEVDKLCDRVIILKKGKVFIDNEKLKIMKDMKIGKNLSILCTEELNKKDFSDLENCRIEGNKIYFNNLSSEEIVEKIKEINSGYNIIDMKIDDVTFEDVFKTILKGDYQNV